MKKRILIIITMLVFVIHLCFNLPVFAAGDGSFVHFDPSYFENFYAETITVRSVSAPQGLKITELNFSAKCYYGSYHGSGRMNMYIYADGVLIESYLDIIAHRDNDFVDFGTFSFINGVDNITIKAEGLSDSDNYRVYIDGYYRYGKGVASELTVIQAATAAQQAKSSANTAAARSYYNNNTSGYWSYNVC